MDKGKNQHPRQFQVQHLLFIFSCNFWAAELVSWNFFRRPSFSSLSFFVSLDDEVKTRLLQAEIDERISDAREASRAAKAKDREIEMLGSRLTGK